jgi:redox-sensitive bicupin YhaK (pirin superfamily)
MHDFGHPTKVLGTGAAADPGPPTERVDKITGWHPHRGFDIITYMKEGRGSHADSLGNQAVVRPGGIQWLRCGSGIEHAEGGGNPEGANQHGFQIWINLPQRKKMSTPSYGTIQPEEIPEQAGEGGGTSRFVGGVGSQAFAPDLREDFQIVDCELPGPNATHRHELPGPTAQRVLVYCYQGAGTVGGTAMKPQQTAVMTLTGDGKELGGGTAAAGAQSLARRRGGAEASLTGVSVGEPAALEMVATSPDGFGVLIFAGAPIDEPISWRGPIVMGTAKEIDTAWSELQRGGFYKKRADGDWRAMAERSDVPYTTLKVPKTPALPHQQ